MVFSVYGCVHGCDKIRILDHDPDKRIRITGSGYDQDCFSSFHPVQYIKCSQGTDIITASPYPGGSQADPCWRRGSRVLHTIYIYTIWQLPTPGPWTPIISDHLGTILMTELEIYNTKGGLYLPLSDPTVRGAYVLHAMQSGGLNAN